MNDLGCQEGLKEQGRQQKSIEEFLSKTRKKNIVLELWTTLSYHHSKRKVQCGK